MPYRRSRFDAPPLHTLYLDRPLKGALLMRTLARVNRTFRGKPAGLLVAYAPLAENLNDALAEYTETDRAEKPVGKDIDEAAALTTTLIGALDEVCAGYAWRSKLDGGPKSWIRAAVGVTEYLRSPATPGNQVPDGEESLGDRFRKLANQLARAWALCSGSQSLNHLRVSARFYEEVRGWMGKFDAQARQAEGKPVPEEVQRMLAALVATSTASGEIVERELVAVMRRDVKTDWTVRDDVRAKLRSSIKRLLVKYKYPPDKQPDAIKLVIEQMEAMAPRYVASREG
jgi:type I restriction enzyme, R subunit